jgi:mRNA-degrading endonuclease RelE of RelBE toxin-antitoxin system
MKFKLRFTPEAGKQLRKKAGTGKLFPQKTNNLPDPNPDKYYISFNFLFFCKKN